MKYEDISGKVLCCFEKINVTRTKRDNSYIKSDILITKHLSNIDIYSAYVREKEKEEERKKEKGRTKLSSFSDNRIKIHIERREGEK